MLRALETTPPQFSKRSGHVAITRGRFMIVWGGFTNIPINNMDRDEYISSSELSIYDTETYNWIKHKTHLHLDHPTPTSAAGSLVLDNYLYVLCGHSSFNGHVSYVSRLPLGPHVSPSDLRWELLLASTKVPSPRDKFTCWDYNKKIYCFGGFGIPFHCNLNYLDDNGSFQHEELEYHWLGWNNQLVVFDPDTCEWSNPTCKGDVPVPRAAHCSAILGHTVYVFGGRHRRTRMNDLYSLDLQTLTWNRLYPEQNGPIPIGRSWCSFTAVTDERIVLYGGYTQDEKPLSDIWTINVKIPQWTEIYITSHWPRLWHTACLTRDQSILIYGGCSHNIRDSSQRSEHCGQVLELRISPMSLERLALDATFAHRECTKPGWPLLPKDLNQRLQKRFDSWVKYTFDRRSVQT